MNYLRTVSAILCRPGDSPGRRRRPANDPRRLRRRQPMKAKMTAAIGLAALLTTGEPRRRCDPATQDPELRIPDRPGGGDPGRQDHGLCQRRGAAGGRSQRLPRTPVAAAWRHQDADGRGADRSIEDAEGPGPRPGRRGEDAGLPGRRPGQGRQDGLRRLQRRATASSTARRSSRTCRRRSAMAGRGPGQSRLPGRDRG